MFVDSFYQTFWSLQLPFSKPPVFASPQLAPPQGWTFAQFQDAVDKVLPVIKEATAKERAMMGAGSRSTATLRSKHEHDEKEDSEGNEMDYFFAKFLTSPELLDLEVRVFVIWSFETTNSMYTDCRYSLSSPVPSSATHSPHAPPPVHKSRETGMDEFEESEFAYAWRLVFR